MFSDPVIVGWSSIQALPLMLFLNLASFLVLLLCKRSLCPVGCKWLFRDCSVEQKEFPGPPHIYDGSGRTGFPLRDNTVWLPLWITFYKLLHRWKYVKSARKPGNVLWEFFDSTVSSLEEPIFIFFPAADGRLTMLYFQVVILTATLMLVYYCEFTDIFSPSQQGFICNDPALSKPDPGPEQDSRVQPVILYSVVSGMPVVLVSKIIIFVWLMTLNVVIYRGL